MASDTTRVTQRLQSDTVEQALAGSPYSLPSDELGRQRMLALETRLEELDNRCARLHRSLQRQMAGILRTNQRVREIYESNAIEGLGASLMETQSLLTSTEAIQIQQALNRHAVVTAVAAEPKVQQVLGLYGAKLVAEELASTSGRFLTEADLRGMHALILGSEMGAGEYKRYHNQIEGSSHIPVAPIDVPGAMRELSAWLAGTIDHTDLPPVLRSAVAHAWLTHIHPFVDGNGRMARLVASMILGGRGYPPLVVKHHSDRGRYLDALAHSDVGGDIVPLGLLFVRVLNRLLAEMEDPNFALELFKSDLRRRGGTMFEWWDGSLTRFMDVLAAELLLHRFTLERVGWLARSDFELLRRRDSSGNSWIAKARDQRGDGEVLLWLGYVSSELYNRLSSDQVYPTLFLSVPDRSPGALHKYKRAGTTTIGLDEALLIPGATDRVLIRAGNKLQRATPLEFARHLATQIAYNGRKQSLET
jgi:Fic family protein